MMTVLSLPVSNIASTIANNSVCPRCGMEFGCGVQAGEAHCWCMDLPPAGLPVEAAASCLCPVCLTQARVGNT